MCGIAGIAPAKNDYDRLWPERSSETIRHRGPDASGEWWSADNKVGLAHKRLSIIDLSEKADQPMSYKLGNCTIIFNGEIYNFKFLRNLLEEKGYKFETKSDTEVLLKSYHYWGSKCLDKLEGMYAFAIYDENENKLFLARDRVGEKPLYYSHINNKLIFCSELKGLLAHRDINRIINMDALNCYLSMGFVPGDLSIISKINKLPAGSFMEYKIKENTLRVKQYWDLPNDFSKSKKNEEELLEKLENLLTNSVKKQLIADVPVGILLSGGIDSSLVTALASKENSHVKTFNVRFSDHSKFDESKHARLISSYYGTDHTEINANEISPDLLSKLAYQYDEPIADSSMIPTFIVCQAVKEHCSVALGGDGGDELFGGYPHYSRMLWLMNNTHWIPKNIKNLISSTSGNLLSAGFKGRNWLISMNTNFEEDVPFISNLYDISTREKLLGKKSNSFVNAEEIRKKFIYKTNSLLDRATRLDFKLFLTEDLLVKIDRASMLNSLELRSPFLDRNLIEFAFNDVSSELKSNQKEKKILLKKLARKLLPEKFNINRKQGFSVPIGEWIKSGPWLKYFETVLLDNETIFNKKVVENLINHQKKGYNNTERLFALVMFENWRRVYNINL
mgnify:CR=1 FL=1